MKDFQGKIAIVTGGGTGMGRELAKQLASEGCNLAICDVIVENMAETKEMCEELAPPNTLISAHECDVSDEGQVVLGPVRELLAETGVETDLVPAGERRRGQR